MRTWGQWIEFDKIYGIVLDKDYLYRFNHWKKQEWHGPNPDLLKRPEMKFYIQLIF